MFLLRGHIGTALLHFKKPAKLGRAALYAHGLARACAARGRYSDQSWVLVVVSINLHFFGTNILSLKILTFRGSLNLMASDVAEQLDKSSWPSQILLVCCLGKGLTTPETQTLHQLQTTPPMIADTVPKWLNMPTLRAVKSHLLRVRLPVFMVFSPSHLLSP